MRKLGIADRVLGEGKDIGDVCRDLGVSEQTYYRWPFEPDRDCFEAVESRFPDIAEAADVSTRTIFPYFPSREDILFCTTSQMSASLGEALAARLAGTDALATLGDSILASVDQKTDLGRKLGGLIAADATLTSHQRARLAERRDLFAPAIADNLGAPQTIWGRKSPRRH